MPAFPPDAPDSHPTGESAVSWEAERFEAAAWSDLIAAAPPGTAAAVGLSASGVAGATAFAAPRLPSTEFNRVTGLGLGRAPTAGDLAAIVAHYRTLGCREVWAQIAAPLLSGLAPMLGGAGLTDTGKSWVMVERPASPPPPARTGLRIAELAADGAEESGRVFRTGYGLPPLFEAWNAGLVGRPGWRAYAAFDGQRMAAVAYSFRRSGRAILIGAATLPEARGRGAQSALLARRIADAQDEGAQVVQTHTGLPAPGARNPSLDNMLRAGFRPTHLRRNWALPL